MPLPVSDERPAAADRVPVLTEVVELRAGVPEPAGTAEGPVLADDPPAGDSAERDAAATPLPPAPASSAAEPVFTVDPYAPFASAASPTPVAAAAPAPAQPLDAPVQPLDAPAQPPDASALVDEVLAALAPRLDALFEDRVRAALAPAIARAAEGLIRDARQELAATLCDVVEEAVRRTLRAHEPPPTSGSGGAGPAG